MASIPKMNSELSPNEKRMARQRSLKLGLSFLALTASIFSAQACGQFNGAPNDAASLSSSSTSTTSSTSTGDTSNGTTTSVNNPEGFEVVPISTTLTTSSIINFTYGGPSTLDANASVLWTHTVTNANGVAISSCAEINGNSSFPYQLDCPVAGNLTISMTIYDKSVVNGPITKTFVIGSTSSGATPTPTPASTPNPAGVALYTTNCQSCHGALAQTQLSVPTVAAIDSAIQNTSAMKGLSSLTAAQIQEISDALYGK